MKPKMKPKTIETLSDLIAKECAEMHEGIPERPNVKWSPLFGQWLVYSFEQYIGFGEAAGLCAVVETAYNRKQDVKQAVAKYFAEEL